MLWEIDVQLLLLAAISRIDDLLQSGGRMERTSKYDGKEVV